MTTSIVRDNESDYAEISHKVISLFERRMPVQKITTVTGVAPTLIRKILSEEYGENPSKARDSRLADHIINAHKKGIAGTDIAEKFGISERTVYRKLRGHRPAREIIPIDAETDKLINALLDDRTPYTEIAATVGISSQRLARNYPGRGWSTSETAQFMAWLRRNPQAREILKWKSAK